MTVLYHTRHPLRHEEEVALHAKALPLPQVLQAADIVTIHTPLIDSTRGLIGKAELAMMRRSAYLINTARGEVVDEAALAEALEQGRLAGAGLDVYQHEPRVQARLLALPNTVLLPHLGSATTETRVKMGLMVADNISAVLEGREAPHRVN